jgi:hypothetical protein
VVLIVILMILQVVLPHLICVLGSAWHCCPCWHDRWVYRQAEPWALVGLFIFFV